MRQGELTRFSARTAWAFFLALLLASSPVTTDPSSAARETERLVSVIVQGLTTQDAKAAVESVGGRVTLDLPIVNGVAADVDRSALPSLRSARGVREVTPDAPIRFLGKPAPNPTASPSPSPTSTPTTCTPTKKKPCPSPSPTPTTSPTPTSSPSPTVSPSPTTSPTPPARSALYQTTNSDDLWAQGYTGNDIRVAVLDTGVYAAHPDLQGGVNGGSRVVHCEDFTEEAAPRPADRSSDRGNATTTEV